MKKFIYTLTALSLLFACNPEENLSGDDKPDSLIVSVTTGDAVEIEQSSAKLCGVSVISNAKASSGVALFNYGTSADGISTNGKKIDAGSIPGTGGDFSVSITGLEPATTYYYAASVTIDGKTTTGATKSFITKDKPKDPTITGEAKDITEWSAKLSGYANPTQEMGNVTMGILLSTDENPTLDNSKELTSEELDGNNMYTVKATGLNSGTTYYYKSFIKYGGVRRSGEVKSFQTKGIDASTVTEAASDITLFSATINGKLSVNSTESLSKSVWFLFSDKELDSDQMKNEGEKHEASLKDDGYFSYSVGDLSYNTTYYYLACSKVHDKEFYGNVKSFVSTDIAAVVSITTNEAADVYVTKATLSGSLSIESSETLNKSVWFLYSASENTLDGLLANGTKVSASLQDGCVFTHILSDLPSNTKYHYVAVAKVQDKEFYGSVKNFTSKDFSATISTKEASDVKLFSATLNGSLSVSSVESLDKEVWFLLSDKKLNSDQMKAEGIKYSSSLNNDGTYSYSVANLSYNTTYYYQACSKVYDREFYGEVLSFSTVDLSSVVSVTTSDAADVTVTKATIGGSLAVTSSEYLNRTVWLFYSTTETTLDGLLSEGTKANASLQNSGVFTHTLSDLPSNTKYHYVAVAKVQDKEFYGSVKNFTSKDFSATVSTKEASDVKLFSVTLNGSLSVSSVEPLDKEVWFLYSATESSLDGLLANGHSLNTTLQEDGSFNYLLSDLSSDTEYHYVAVARVYDKEVSGEVISFTTKAIPGGAVDLGLSVCWAACNIGAATPEDYGDFYAWGETEPYYESLSPLTWKSGKEYGYDWPSYKWCNESSTKLIKYNYNSYYGSVDNKTVLEQDDDVAHTLLGGNWRMPTDDEWTELRQKCSWKWTTQNGVKGRLVTGPNGNSIFLPATGFRSSINWWSAGDAGYYWSSTLYSKDPRVAWGVDPWHDIVDRGTSDRCKGQAIRPVTE